MLFSTENCRLLSCFDLEYVGINLVESGGLIAVKAVDPAVNFVEPRIDLIEPGR